MIIIKTLINADAYLIIVRKDLIFHSEHCLQRLSSSYHYIRCLFVIQHQYITQPPNRINTPVNLDKK